MSKEKLRANKNKDDSYMWDNYTSTPTFEGKQQQITNFMSRKTIFKRKTSSRSPQEQNQENKRLKKLKQRKVDNTQIIEQLIEDTITEVEKKSIKEEIEAAKKLEPKPPDIHKHTEEVINDEVEVTDNGHISALEPSPLRVVLFQGCPKCGPGMIFMWPAA